VKELDNLVKIRQLQLEPRNQLECSRLLTLAITHAQDAAVASVSIEGRFLAAYAAGHAAALAALRYHGYRSDNRFIVFQSLSHTLQWSPAQWRLLDVAHKARNLAEYEGYLDVEEQQVVEPRNGS
jgi:hypothetical protein